MEKEEMLKELLSGDNSMLIKELKHGYVSGISKTMSLTNTTFIMYLFYRNILDKNKEITLQLFEGILMGAHKEICAGIIASLGDHGDQPYIKDEMEGFVSNVNKAMESSFKEITDGVRGSFERIVEQFSKLDESTIERESGNSGGTDGEE